MIAVVPLFTTLPPGELKEAARGDCRLGWMFLPPIGRSPASIVGSLTVDTKS